MESKRVQGPVVSVALAIAGVLLLAHCASLEGLSGSGGDASTPPGPNGSDGATGDGATGDGASGSTDGATAMTDSSGPMLGPGEIFCASTMTVCNIHMAQCCVTLSGTSTMAARAYTTSSAQCGPVNGPNCGQFVSVGSDFTMKFPQQCGTAADCTAGESCCVLPVDAMNRFGKEVASIKCVAAPTCATKGRAICNAPSDCAATENCLAETDPVLSHVYAKFCQ